MLFRSDYLAARSRPALQERSVNQQQPKCIPSPQQKKWAGHSNPPAVPKQVHLKEERAKKAALLAAQAMLPPPPLPPPKQLKRSCGLAIGPVDVDELGILTPAKKKSKRVSIRGGLRRSLSATTRSSLAAKTVELDEMSDDELGM